MRRLMNGAKTGGRYVTAFVSYLTDLAAMAYVFDGGVSWIEGEAEADSSTALVKVVVGLGIGAIAALPNPFAMFGSKPKKKSDEQRHFLAGEGDHKESQKEDDHGLGEHFLDFGTIAIPCGGVGFAGLFLALRRMGVPKVTALVLSSIGGLAYGVGNMLLHSGHIHAKKGVFKLLEDLVDPSLEKQIDSGQGEKKNPSLEKQIDSGQGEKKNPSLEKQIDSGQGEKKKPTLEKQIESAQREKEKKGWCSRRGGDWWKGVYYTVVLIGGHLGQGMLVGNAFVNTVHPDEDPEALDNWDIARFVVSGLMGLIVAGIEGRSEVRAKLMEIGVSRLKSERKEEAGSELTGQSERAEGHKYESVVKLGVAISSSLHGFFSLQGGIAFMQSAYQLRYPDRAMVKYLSSGARIAIMVGGALALVIPNAIGNFYLLIAPIRESLGWVTQEKEQDSVTYGGVAPDLV